MADETYELAVQITDEGMDETQEGLENVEEGFDDTADSVGGSAEEMEGFSRQWRGAMTALTVALGAAVAGLLSKIPIVNEAWAGLSSIVGAVAFQMDSVLRPVFGPISAGLFALSGAIYDAEGAWGVLIGIIGTAIAVFLMVKAAAAALSAVGVTMAGVMGVLSGIWGALTSVAAAVGGAIAALAATLGISFGAAAALVIGAVLAVIAIAWLLWDNWDTVTGFLGDAWDWLKGVATDSWDAIVAGGAALLSWISDLPGRIGRWLSSIGQGFLDLITDAWNWGVNLVSNWWNALTRNIPSTSDLSAAFTGVTDWFGGLLVRAFRWGESLVDGFQAGIKRQWSGLTSWVGDKVDGLTGTVTSALGIGSPSKVFMDIGHDVVAGFEQGVDPLQSSFLGRLEKPSGLGDGARSHAFAGSRQEIVVQLDGRELTRFVSDDQKRGFDDRGRSPG